MYPDLVVSNWSTAGNGAWHRYVVKQLPSGSWEVVHTVAAVWGDPNIIDTAAAALEWGIQPNDQGDQEWWPAGDGAQHGTATGLGGAKASADAALRAAGFDVPAIDMEPPQIGPMVGGWA